MLVFVLGPSIRNTSNEAFTKRSTFYLFILRLCGCAVRKTPQADVYQYMQSTPETRCSFLILIRASATYQNHFDSYEQ